MTRPTGRAVRRAVVEVEESRAYGWLVRTGLVCYGTMHLLIAVLAGRMAVAGTPRDASQTGALRALARSPLGPLMLWIIGIGFLTIAAWQLIAAARGRGEFVGAKHQVKRLSSLGRAAIYVTLGVSSIRIVLGRPGGDETGTISAWLLSSPAGQVLLAGLGARVVALGVTLAIKPFTLSYRDDLDRPLGPAGRWLAAVGHLGKGGAFVGVGALLIWAAVVRDPEAAGGLDRALQSALGMPSGPWVIGAVALGFACYGVYCFLWARRAKI